MNYFNILLIAAIWVFLLDLSGAWQSMTTHVSSWLTNDKVRKPIMIKPFACSLCMTFWTGLLYILIAGCFTLPMVAFVCLMAYLTPRIKDVLIVADAMLALLFDRLISGRNKDERIDNDR